MRMIASIWLLFLFAPYLNGQVHIKAREKPPVSNGEISFAEYEKYFSHPFDYYTILNARLDKFKEARDFKGQVETYADFISFDTVKERIPRWHNRMSLCYDSLNDKQSALHHLRLAITSGDFDYSYQKRWYFIRLSDHFLKNKQYDSVNYYFKILTTKPSIRNLCGSSSYSLHTNLNYRRMKALDEVGLVDSAIKVFSQFAFQPALDNTGTEYTMEHIHENDYHCQVIDFLKILQKKYTCEEIIKEAHSLLDPALLSLTRSTTNNACWLEGYYNIRFFNFKNSEWIMTPSCEDYAKNPKKVYQEWVEQTLKDKANIFIYQYITRYMTTPSNF